MDTKYIPEEILNNPNFNLEQKDRIKELNDLFYEIHTTDKSIIGTKDYKDLIKEINGRHDAEMLVKNNRLINKEVQEELRIAKEKLQYLQNKV
tara:strand:- start:165 stop:443 length:279 start_codon:yes stop_codon:yes gene_type:complete